MANDDTIDPKKIQEVNSQLDKLEKNIGSVGKLLLSNAQTEKDQAEISKLLIKAKQEEIKILQSSKNKDTTAGRIKQRLLNQELNDLKEHSIQLKKSQEFVGAFGNHFKKLPIAKSVSNFTKLNLQAKLATVAFHAISGLASSIGSLVIGFADAESKVKGFEKLGELMFPNKGFVGKKFIAMGRAIDFNISNFKTLAQRGADFESSVINMRNAAARSRMPLLDFVDYVSNNSDVLASLFGNVQDGVRNFETLAVRLRNITRNEFSQFGLTLEDTNEFMTSFMELERARGRAQTLTQDELIQGTQQYTRQLILFSKLTGESVENMDKLNRQQAVNAKFQTLLAGLAPEEASRLRNFNTFLERTNPAMAQLFQETYAVGGAMNENTAVMNAMSGNGLVPLFKLFIQRKGAEEEVINGLRMLSNNVVQNGKTFAIASLANGQFTEQLSGFSATAGALSKNVEDQIKPLKTSTGAFVGFQDTMDQLKSAVEKKATEVLGITLFNEKYANDFIREASQKISKFSLDLANFNIFSAVYDVGKKALRVVSPAGFLISKLFNPKGGQQADTSGNVPTVVSPDDDMTMMPMYKDGSKGFRDFGSGTLVKLHNKETVIPLNSPMGKVVASLEGAKLDQNPQKVQNITNTISNVTAGDKDYDRLAAVFSQGFSTLAGKMDESVNRLNMIAGASAKTADNTEKQIKTLARNPYSIV